MCAVVNRACQTLTGPSVREHSDEFHSRFCDSVFGSFYRCVVVLYFSSCDLTNMFRRFADRIGSLVYGESTDNNDSGMAALQSMGFNAEQARSALLATDGDVDRAAELLLAGVDTTSSTTGVASLSSSSQPPPELTITRLEQGDDALQRALQESVQMEEDRRMRLAQEESFQRIPQPRTVAMSQAAEAAEKRAVTRNSTTVRNKTTTKSIPTYRTTTFPDKSVEDEVHRCCDQLKSYPAAVDTLYRALTAVQKDPDNEKYRTITKTSNGYQRSMQHVPGVEEFLWAMKFAPNGVDAITLERSEFDSDLLLFGISVLEKVKDTFQYQEEKRRIQAKSAFAKFENALQNHHPEVKVPAKLENKSKEEQILRCGDRLKAYPAAVDTLYRALTAIQKDPDTAKFRTIDKTSAGYQRSVEGAPGAEALLKAMNFTPRGTNTFVLDRSMVDPALLFLGVSALEQAKDSVEYKDGKRKLQFAKEVQEVRVGGNYSETEAVRRADYMSKCPTEPSDGRGALMQVVISDESVRRRFDGDDVLRDVLNWLGGHGSVIPEKILSREWCLVDLNRYPLVPIDCTSNLDKTLQHIGCWPSGRMEIQPSSDEWRLYGSVGNAKPGSSRGLGAARMDFS